jgi:hypothetical protein
MALLQAPSITGILVQLPYWFLMIVLPQHLLTRRLTSSYRIFAAPGIIFVSIVVGLIPHQAKVLAHIAYSNRAMTKPFCRTVQGKALSA